MIRACNFFTCTQKVQAVKLFVNIISHVKNIYDTYLLPYNVTNYNGFLCQVSDHLPFLALVLKQKATLAAPALLQVRTTILLLFFSLYEACGHFKLANHRPVSIFCAASKVLQNFNYVFWLSHQDQYHYWRSKQFLHILYLNNHL